MKTENEQPIVESKTKIFVTDDHLMIVEGIRTLLANRADILWLGHATDAESCMRAITADRPDVLLLDINLEGASGIDLCREVKRVFPEIRVIGLSSFNQKSYISRMLNNNASGYILKNENADELIEAIKAVMRDEIYLSTEARAAMEAMPLQSVPVITKREKEVLHLIAEGLTNGAIAEKLFISQTTVETHRKNLLAKFDTKNTANLVKLAAQFGFI